MSLKNSNGTVGNQSRDLPACSAVRQPTAPPRDPQILCIKFNFIVRKKFTMPVKYSFITMLKNKLCSKD
jgi:hypothetical protein